MNILWRIVELDERAHEKHPNLVPFIEVVLCVVGAFLLGLILVASYAP